ncbi:uncharacterized protein JCM10292_005806 [Rhodotorula paludigena]|uniref:uncharacterized protein n=1 Tax=Rhodotorula paludigena TaxID=86838 RepID=UPI003171012E
MASVPSPRSRTEQPAGEHLRLTDSVRTLLATILNDGVKPAHDQFNEELKRSSTQMAGLLHVFNGLSELTPLLAHLNGTTPPREWTDLRKLLFRDLAAALAGLRVRPDSPARTTAQARHPDSIVAFVKRLHVELRAAQQIKDELPDKIKALEKRLAELKDDVAAIASREVAGRAERDAKKREAKAAREKRAQVDRELMVAKSKLATHLKTMAVVKRLVRASPGVRSDSRD